MTTAARVSAHTAALVDLFISNIIGSNALSVALCCYISDSFYIFKLLGRTILRNYKRALQVKMQRITQSALCTFHCCVWNCTWESLFSAEMRNNACNQFRVVFRSIYNFHFKETIVGSFSKTRKSFSKSSVQNL